RRLAAPASVATGTTPGESIQCGVVVAKLAGPRPQPHTETIQQIWGARGDGGSVVSAGSDLSVDTPWLPPVSSQRGSGPLLVPSPSPAVRLGPESSPAALSPSPPASGPEGTWAACASCGPWERRLSIQVVVAAISSGTPSETPSAGMAIPESLIARPIPSATAMPTRPGPSIGVSRPMELIGVPEDNQANSPPLASRSAVRIGRART